MTTSTAYLHFRDKPSFETDAWDLNELLRQHKVVVVDARAATAYANEHIPGAINLPHRKIDASTTQHFDRSAMYVTYCDGTGCNASTKGALKLAELGFEVKELIGGLDWWKRDGYPTECSLVTIG